MKKLALLISLMAFIFVASVSTSYAQSSDDKAKTEKVVSDKKDAPAKKAPCPKAAKCGKHKPGHKCSHSKKAPCPSSAKKKEARKSDDAVIEEKDKTK